MAIKTKLSEAKRIEQVRDDKANAKIMQSGSKAKAQDAFNIIYKRYKSAIFYKALRYVKMNNEVAEDLVQEIFVKVFQRIKSYDFSVAFSTWLYNVAKNHIIDYKRRDKVEVLSVESLRNEYGGDEDVNEISFQLQDRSSDTLKDVIKKERATAVRAALNNGVKSEEAKQVISFIFLEELPYKEVAQKMNMPEGTVKAIMFRAKMEMKEYLTKKGRDFTYN